MKLQRNKAWRRQQDQKIIRKRLNILTQVWGYGTLETGNLREQDNPGRLRKYNFTCSCGLHKMDRYYNKRDKRKRESLRNPYENHMFDH